MTPGLKSASNAHRIHETPHTAAFFYFRISELKIDIFSMRINLIKIP
ncbi:hypothetical protein CSC18_3688 [Klebsiella aerogenes]|nr:hypothetical protein CSC18_3688 [Klebsiella aerogenes]